MVRKTAAALNRILILLTLLEYEQDKVKCPKCGGKRLHQEAAAFFAVTPKKN
jgi:hypothetical protein